MILVYSTQLLSTGGIESHLLEFCKQIHAKGVKVDLLVFNSFVDPKQKVLYQSYCNRLILISSSNRLIRFSRLISSGIRLRKNSYTAIYTNGQGNSISFIQKLLGQKNKWIHHHHTSGDAFDQSHWSPTYIKMMKEADKVIACSDTNAQAMSSALNREIDVIYCFSRKVKILPSKKEANKPVHLGYFGRLIKEKGITTICRMSEEIEFQNIIFHIWGSVSTYDETFFKRYPKVHYHGKFDDLEGLEKALSILDGFLLLSTHSEGLPISLLEVTSSGTPWLATDKGGIPDIMLDEVSTRIISADSSYQEITKAVLSFAEDIRNSKISPDLLKSLYEERFSSVALIKKWFSILDIN